MNQAPPRDEGLAPLSFSPSQEGMMEDAN
jgi:hypothetical protein